MNVKFYNIDDQDTLEALFGEGRPMRSISNPSSLGELIFEGALSCLPEVGSTVIVEGEEYNVICPIFNLKCDSVDFITQPKIYVEVELS